MLALAAFQSLLHRYSGQAHICVGTAIANRRKEVEELIGFFANTIVMRGDLRGEPTFREFLHRTKEGALAAYTNQDVPFERIVEELRPERRLSYSPLFQVMLILLNQPKGALKVDEVKLNQWELNTGAARYELTLTLLDVEQGLLGSLEYNTDLFDGRTIKRILGHFGVMLQSIAADVERRISGLGMLTGEEVEQLLVEWNDTGAEFPRGRCIHELFEEQARVRPDGVAVSFVDEWMSYKELNRRANQLAQYLRGVGV